MQIVGCAFSVSFETTMGEYEQLGHAPCTVLSFNQIWNPVNNTTGVKKANNRTYTSLVNELRDQYLFKNDVYLQNMQEAYNLLKNHNSMHKKTGADRQDTGGDRFQRSNQDNDRIIRGV